MSKSHGRGTLWCESGPWQEMVAEASDRGLRETGGVLLGWRNGADVVVSHVVGPGPNAQHRRTAFHPDSAWQAARIGELYEESGRRLEYLGDWHTHPGGRPWPSRRDERTLRHIAGSAEARCPDPVMVILGSSRADEDSAWRVGAFVRRACSRWRWRPRVVSVRFLIITDSTGERARDR